MKYYLFQGRTDKMEDRLFPILLRNQPDVVELTKQEYENNLGIGPKGSESQKSKDVGQHVVQDTAKEDDAPVPGGIETGTKKEIIEVLKGRGFGVGQLTRKTKQQLIEML